MPQGGTGHGRNNFAYGSENVTTTTFADHSARHENGGADEISVAGLSGTLADPQPFGVKQTEVDFGAVTATYESTFTITDASVSTTSRISAWLSTDAPTGKDADDLYFTDPLECRCTAGSGQFDLAISCETPLNDKYKINYMIGTTV